MKKLKLLNPIKGLANLSSVLLLVLISNAAMAQMSVVTSVTLAGSAFESTKVCGDIPSEVTVAYTNISAGALSFTNIIFSTDLLEGLPAATDDGIVFSGSPIATFFGAMPTTLTVSNLATNTSEFQFKINENVLLESGERIELKFSFFTDCRVFGSPFNAALNTRNVATQVNAEIISSTASNVPIVNTEASHSYQLLFPVFTLEPVKGSVNHTMKGYKGQQLTRELDLCNEIGAGSIDHFQIKIVYPSSSFAIPLSSLSISNGVLDRVLAAATIDPDGITYRYEVSAADIAALYPSGQFMAGTFISIKEPIEIQECPESLPSTEYFIEWGCAPSSPAVCNVDDVNATTYVVVDKDIASPVVAVVLDNTSPGTPCTNSAASPASLEIKIQNNASLPRDQVLNIKPYINYSSGILLANVFVVNNAGADVLVSTALPSSSGGYIDLSVFYASLTISTAANFGLNDLDGDGVFDDLGVGETLKIKAEYYFQNCASLPACTITNNFFSARAEFQANCNAASLSSNTALLKDEDTSLGSTGVKGPTDMVANGSSATFTFSPQLLANENQLTLPNASNYSVNIILPANYQLAGSPNAVFIDKDAPGSPVSLTATPSGQVINLVGGGTNGTYSIDLVLNCGAYPFPADNFEIVKWELVSEGFAGCVCAKTLLCAELETYNHFAAYCPGGTGGYSGGANGGGTCGGIRSTSFVADRVTYGFSQTAPNNTSGIWTDAEAGSAVSANDATGGINKKAAYECDEIQVTAKGLIAGFTCNNVHIKVTYRPMADAGTGSAELLALVPSSSTISSTGSGNINVQDPVPSYDSENKVWVYDFVLPGNPAVFGGEIILKTKFSVPKNSNIPLEKRIERFRGQHYILTSDNTVESWGANFDLYRTVVTISENNVPESTNFCDMKRALKLTVSGGSGGDDFPNEFRSIAHSNNINYSLPPNYTYLPGSAKLKVTMGSVNNVIAIDNPVITGSLVAGFNLSWARNGGGISWPLIDKAAASTDMVLEFELLPNCDAISAGTFAATMDHSHYDYAPAGCSEPTIVSNKSTANPRALPILVVSGLNPTGHSNTVEIPFTLTNTGKAAPNTWIAFEGPTGASFSDIKDASGSLGGDVAYGFNNESLWVKVNNLNTGPTSYSITANFASCTEGGSSPIKFYTGWDCTEYPSSPYFPENTSFSAATVNTCGGIASGYSSSTINVVHQTAILGSSPISFAPSKDICDETVFNTSLYSQGQADVTAVRGFLNLPAGVMLVGLKAKFIGVGVDPATVSFVAINTESLNSNSWNFSTALSLANGQLKPGESIGIECSILPSCLLNPGETVDFYGTANNSCSAAIASGIQKARIPITGFDASTMSSISVSVLANDFVEWNLNSDIAISVNNSAGTPNPSPVEVKVQLPIEVEYVSHVGIAFDSKVVSETGTTITWIFPSNAITNSELITVSVRQNCALDNDKTISVSAETSIIGTSPCATSGGAICTIKASTYKAADNLTLKLSPDPIGCENCVGSFAPEAGDYVISAWVKEENGESLPTYLYAQIKLSFTESIVEYDGIIPDFSSPIIDGWQRIEYPFTIPPEATEIKIDLKNTSPSSASKEVFFDDIRIHPFDSNMKSYVYDPVSFRLLAELDENNFSTFYEYDEDGALIRVKKETERGIMTIKETRNNNKK